MTIKEIKEFPVTIGHGVNGQRIHESVLRGYQILEKAKELFATIYEIGISLGGTISGEHGLGFSKKGFLPMVADTHKIDLMKRIKRAFDPNNIMNPGKIFDM